ncbi:hypothetical protein, conserved [Eimeria acervulina]|uniref:Uncharacterized protein n=1 Tax=Eimeria acervulina TaxID=5801 RepID=U6GXH6_EIMAC|nr:hypothetical protein, conserved [Eimeria acervulina]CDI83953.1 hypothetical protein, conserved [Eimeria acervulina]
MGIRGQPDKRGDGAAGFSPSPSTSKRRTGRDAAAWNDPELFGGEEDEWDRRDRDRALYLNGKPDKKPSADEKGRRSSTFSVPGESDQEGKENAADAAAATPAESRRGQRRTRQPPLSAASFLQSPEGAPADGLLSLYCNLNYARDKLHKFKFFDRDAAREVRKKEYKKELEAAQALLAMNARQKRQQPQRTPELLQAEITVRSRRRQLARLAGEERLELREDLNTLLREVREGIVAFYPYNEHISRLARRLDKISAQPDLWAHHRPRLVQLHLSGFLKKWMDRGCPPDPYALLQQQTRGGTTTAAAAEAEGEEAETGGPSYMDEDVRGPPDLHEEEEYPFPYDEPWAQTNPTEATQVAAPAQPDTEKAATGRIYVHTPKALMSGAGPSEEELKELRQKQMEAKARREKLRAAQQQQQQQQTV